MNMQNSEMTTTGSFLEKVINTMPGGVFVYRANEKQEILYMNREILHLWDCQDKDQFMEFCGGSFRGMIHPDDRDLVEQEIISQLRLGNRDFDHVRYRMINREGKLHTVENFGKYVDDPDLGGLFFVFTVDSKVRNVILGTDFLTGFPGRELFLRYAAEWFQDPEFYYSKSDIIYVNIRNFKMINLHDGVEEGDRLLRQTAEILRKSFPDSLISRFTDDHFVIFHNKRTDRIMLKNIAEEISRLRSRDDLTCKIGIFHITERINPQEACDLAKMACDSIRERSDVDIAEFTPQLRKETELREHLLNHLDQAIEERDIQVYYQPIVRAVTHTLCGMEALSRWKDPSYGFLSPQEFIPVLEESHLIYKLDEHVIRTVCRDLRRFLDQDVHVVPVSINVSKVDFNCMDIEQVLEACMRQYSLPRKLINIEITESTFAEDAEQVERQMMRLRDAGHQIIMDDFGSGYSSLNVLKDYDFDQIKLDMGFLTDFSRKARDILASTVEMAKKIGVQTLAEGVERQEEFEFLRSIGCEKIQGYYFCKPLPPEEALEVCKKKKIRGETEGDREFYQNISAQKYMQDEPMAIFSYQDKKKRFQYLYCDKAYLSELKKLYPERSDLTTGEVLELLDRQIHEDDDYPMKRSLFQRLHYVGSIEGTSSYSYPLSDGTLDADYRKIAEDSNTQVFLSHLHINRRSPDSTELDSELLRQNLYYLYDEIFVINLDSGQIKSLSAPEMLGNEQISAFINADQTVKQIMQRYICECEYERYLKFMDLNTLANRLEHADGGVLNTVFRVKTRTREKVFNMHRILQVQGTEKKIYLYLIYGVNLSSAKEGAILIENSDVKDVRGE